MRNLTFFKLGVIYEKQTVKDKIKLILAPKQVIVTYRKRCVSGI